MYKPALKHGLDPPATGLLKPTLPGGCSYCFERAFPVTCTILGSHQLLGKIQKEMLFRKFGSTGRKVLAL
jgi:hypothetical protein